MSSPNVCHTQFESRLPPLPAFSPLILGSLHTPDLVQWHQQLEYCCLDHSTSSNPQSGPSSDTSTRENAGGILSHNDTDNKNENHVIDPLRSRLELATELSLGENSCQEQISASPLKNDSEPSPSTTCPESNSAVIHLPPVHDVGAFHAHACIVEVLAPAMQRGSSLRAEVIGTTETEATESGEASGSPTSPSPMSAIDLEFLSFSPLFSPQPDNALLSPSWNLELTLSSSWHLAAASAISLSHPVEAQGSSLVRRPATRRKGPADPNSPKLPGRKSPYMKGSRTLFDVGRKRTPVETGILRAVGSPMLKSHGYRVRFEEVVIR